MVDHAQLLRQIEGAQATVSVLLVRIDLCSQVDLSFVRYVYSSILGQSDIFDLFILLLLPLIIFDGLLILERLIRIEFLHDLALVLPLEYLDLLDTDL